jgi:hypothetical protein
MIHRIFLVLGAVALLFAVSTADAQAAHYRSASYRSVGSYRAARASVTYYQPKRCVYPRVRQINGKTLWDLGKQNGQWPSF